MRTVSKVILLFTALAVAGLIFYKHYSEYREFYAPGPLRYESKSTHSSLTATGTLEWTNTNRQQNGLSNLVLNEKLNLAAKSKMNDMFVRQYFAHYGPGNTFGASELAEKNGYDYIAIGENLALGNFENDKELVQAWMDSPGHRANILNNRFEEIGIAVGEGTFEGKQTWIAVQIFAKPASSCSVVNSSLDFKIKQNQITLDNMRTELSQKRHTSPQEYNALVKEYNTLVAETKNIVETYNSQVRVYNACIQN